MSSGGLGIIAAVGAGLLLFLFGGDADAEEPGGGGGLPGGGGSGPGGGPGGGGGFIEPDDALGVAESEKLAGFLSAAVKACPDTAHCDTAQLRKVASQIQAYPWKHPDVGWSAIGEAETLIDTANQRDQLQADENSLLGSMLVPPCGDVSVDCADKLYAKADEIRSIQWQTPVGQSASEHAAAYEAAAKKIEDALAIPHAQPVPAGYSSWAEYYQDKWEE